MTVTPLLERHIELCVVNAHDWIEPVLRAAQNCLLTPGHPSTRGLSREPVARAIELLQRRGNPLAHGFEQELGRQLRADVAPRRSTPASPGSFDDLQLVDEEQAAEEVEIVRTIQLVEGGAEWALRELQARTATLRGQSAVGARSNPLRPEVVARSLWAAIGNLGLTGAPRRALLRAAGDALTPAMQKACADATGWLTEWGVAPAAWKAVSVASGHLPVPPSSGFDITRPGALDELRSVRLRGTPRAAAPRADHEQQMRLAQAVFAALDRLPPPEAMADGVPVAQWMRSLQRRWSGAARDAAQGDTVETLAELFERMLTDPLLPPGVVPRLGRLQPTVLRMAVTEPRLFDDHNHPVWALLNRIANHVLGYDNAADPRLAAFLSQLDPWLSGVCSQRAPIAAGLAEAMVALESLCTAHLRAEQAALGTAIERLRRAEREHEATLRVRQRVNVDISSPQAQSLLPATLREVFLGPWCEAVGRVAVRDGESSPAAERLAALPGEVVASLLPATLPAQRAALLECLPRLAATLQQGLALTSLPPARRKAVTDELLARHTEALSPNARNEAVGSPEDIVRRLRAESNSPAEDAGLARDTVIDESQLDTMPAEMLDHQGDRASPRWLPGAKPGLWCHGFLDGAWRSARVVWLSESRAYWLLTSDAAQVHSLTARAVERLARDGLLRPLEARSLLERAIDRWLADAKAPRS